MSWRIFSALPEGINIGNLRRSIMSINPLETFTSTGRKYLHQPQMIEGIRRGIPSPVSLQVSPTNQCQLRCVFCSVDERDLSLEWKLEDLIETIQKIHVLGIKTVE